MSRLVLVTGGARSGKSGFAVRLAEGIGGRLVYIATATPGDAEMRARIEKHRSERGGGWVTVEEPLKLEAALSAELGKGSVVLIDCLTLWLTNMLMSGADDFESAAADRARRLAGTLRGLDGTAIAVSNEVGMGIVPEGALVRRFRDAAGAVNAVMAESADEVYFMVSGIPLRVK